MAFSYKSFDLPLALQSSSHSSNVKLTCNMFNLFNTRKPRRSSKSNHPSPHSSILNAISFAAEKNEPTIVELLAEAIEEASSPQRQKAVSKTERCQFAFAFDVDGVLATGNPLPLAPETLQHLHSKKIPFIFLTNGGGQHDAIRTKGFTEKFGVPITEPNFVQSHTPFLELVPRYKKKAILVLGGVGNQCRDVAELYGFENVIIPADIYAQIPHYWPFDEISSSYYQKHARTLPQPIAASKISIISLTPTSALQISAIFCFSSPRDFGMDIQLISDLLLSHAGYLGTLSPLNNTSTLPNHGFQQDSQPPLYFSNPDHVWSTKYAHPRFAQGAFRAALTGIWKADKPPDVSLLDIHQYGKPTALTYAYAEKKLLAHRAAQGAATPLRTVYMVGDNEASDIAGANRWKSPAGVEWRSVLVETGVYRKGDVPKVRPTAVRANVWEAVKFGLEREGWPAPEERGR